MSNRAPDDLRALSNADIEILYSIVLTAQNSAAPTYRALFDAYDSVIANHGIRPEHDHTYFRFLLRMGEHGRAPKVSLYAQFEALLAQLGFQLDFSDEGSVSEATTNSTTYSHAALRNIQEPGYSNALPSAAPSRRASFDSSYLTRRDRADDENYSLHSTSPKHSRITSHPGMIRYSLRGDNGEGHRSSRLNLEQTAARSSVYREQERHSSLPLHPSMSDSALVRHRSFNMQGSNSNAQLQTPFIDTRLQKDRNAARHHSFSTVYSQRDFQSLKALAIAKDSRLLLRQSFNQWLTRLDSYRQSKHNVTGIEFSDAKADRARDLFLLTKAFTHWVEIASEQCVRSLVAKRHVMRTRLFNAWRELASIHEATIRRTVLCKFFSAWKARRESVASKFDQSCCFSEVRLIDSAYRAYFWSFCRRRAPLWGAESLKIRVFKTWVRELTRAFKSMNVAARAAKLTIARKVSEVMHAKLMHRLHESYQALQFRRACLLQRYINTIHTATKLTPVVADLEQRHGLQLKRQAYVQWEAKTVFLTQAASFHEKHLLARAWTSWNYRLRILAISIMIEDRLLSDALYRWIMTARLLLSRRLIDQKMRRRTFTCWRSKADKIWSSLALRDSNLQASSWSMRTHQIVARWDMLSLYVHGQQQEALAARRRQLLRHAWQRWKEKRENGQRMERWSNDAHFYSNMTRSMHHLQDATASRKQERRRRAYATIRRKVKAGNARIIIGIWRIRAAAVQTLNLDASRLLGASTHSRAKEYISRWSNAIETILQTGSLAKHRNQQNLTRRAIDRLSKARAKAQHLMTRAETILQGFLEGEVEIIFRKFNWLVFQAELQHETAISLADRNRKKHVRSMIKYWGEKADQLKNLPSSPSPDSRRPGFHLRSTEGEDDVQTRAGLTSSTLQHNLPTPAYLRTPSTRSARPRTRFLTPQHAFGMTQTTIKRTASVNIKSAALRPRAFGVRLQELLQTGPVNELQDQWSDQDAQTEGKVLA